MFDIGTGELLALAVIALFVFGPERLPKIAADAGRLLRQLRHMVAGAKRDLSEQLGPEFQDIDIADLNPRHFVKRHLWDDDLDLADANVDVDDASAWRRSGAHARLVEGERPPYDVDAT